jgi:hypothetical protein
VRQSSGLEANQCARLQLAQKKEMGKLIFRCTRTAMNVQVDVADAAPTYPDSYESVTCPACTRIHLVNKTTGRILGDNEKQGVVPGEKRRD